MPTPREAATIPGGRTPTAGTVARDHLAARAWALFLTLGLLATAGYFLTPAAAAHNAYFATFNLLCAVAVIAGVRLHRPARALPWS